MPLYFFNIVDGVEEPDVTGTLLLNLDDARQQALQFTGEMLQQQSHRFGDGHDLRVEVSDEDRALVFVVTVSAANMFPES